MKMEKVIKGLECCAKWMGKNDIDACNRCPYHRNFSYDDHGCIGEVNNDAIALLKEQETRDECLRRKCVICPHCENCDVDENGLLKKQEAVVPTLDETSKMFYRCGVCGEYVGFIDSDPGDPDEKDNYCRNCGRAVKWNERRKKCNENRKST